MVKEAQLGNVNAREGLISEHQIFIKKIVLKNVSSYEDIDNRDEYSVGLIAFNEAIDSYKPGLRSFGTFAADVIKRRLIDYRRSQHKHKTQTVYMADLSQLPLEEQLDYTAEKIQLRIEIECFVKKLAKHGISLLDLVNETPKHKDSRILCLRIGRLITSDSELCNHFTRYHTIPLKMLLKKMNINAKTIERHRKYIIAICLVLLSDLYEMKEYVMEISRGGDNDVW